SWLEPTFSGSVHLIQVHAGRGEGRFEPRWDPSLLEVPEEHLIDHLRRRGVEQMGEEDDVGDSVLRHHPPGFVLRPGRARVHWSREPHHGPVQHYPRQLRLVAQEWGPQRDPSAQEVPQRARAEGLLEGAIDLPVWTHEHDTELRSGDVDLAGE